MPRRAFVRSALELRPGEGKTVLAAAGMFFCVLASYYVLRPVRDALVLDGDPAFIPWLFTATCALMLAVAPPWGAAVARWPRAFLVPRVYRSFVAQLLVFAALMALHVAPLVLGKVFYVWVSMFNLFVVSVFWSLCADLVGPQTGRRLFGLIAAGGSAGALAGPALTRALAAHVDTEVLLVISAALVECATRCARLLERCAKHLPVAEAGGDERAAHDERAAGEAIGGSPVAGLVRVVSARPLPELAGYMMIAAYLSTFIYLRQADIVKAALPVRAERTAFFAEVELWTSLAALALQLFVAARLLRWLGVGAALVALPVVQGAGALALSLAPGLAVATAVSAAGRALTHGLVRPARELLYTALPRQDRFKAKNVIDTFVFRFGDFSAAWLIRGLTALGAGAASATAPLLAGWLVLAVGLGRGHARRAAARPSAGDRDH